MCSRQSTRICVRSKMPLCLYLLLALCWSPSIASPSFNTSSANQEPRAGRTVAISSGAVSALIAGTSLAGTSESDISKHLSSFDVSADIEIENFTKWPLVDGTAGYVRWGQIKTSVASVEPGRKEAWQVHKSPSSWTGTAGVITYKVEGLDEYLAIVWHAPTSTTSAMLLPLG